MRQYSYCDLYLLQYLKENVIILNCILNKFHLHTKTCCDPQMMSFNMWSNYCCTKYSLQKLFVCEPTLWLISSVWLPLIYLRKHQNETWYIVMFKKRVIFKLFYNFVWCMKTPFCLWTTNIQKHISFTEWKNRKLYLVIMIKNNKLNKKRSTFKGATNHVYASLLSWF